MFVSAAKKGRRHLLIDLAVAISVANLLFIAAWADLGSLQYFLPNGPRRLIAAGIAIDVLLLATVLWSIAQIGRRIDARWLQGLVQFGLLVSFVVPLDWLRRQADVGSLERLGSLFQHPLTGTIGAVCLLLAAYLLVRYLTQMARVAGIAAFLLLPFVVSSFSAMVWPDPLFGFASAATRSAREDPVMPRTDRRLVWLLFDEFDYRSVFVDRDRSVELPELDRFARQAVVATSAIAQQRGTITAIPSLTVGHVVTGAAVADHDLVLTAPDGPQKHRWSKEATLFSDANQAGFNVHIVGWYHRYCDVMRDVVTTCWQESHRPEANRWFGLADAIGIAPHRAWAKFPLVDRMGLVDVVPSPANSRTQRALQIDRYQRIKDHALAAMTAPNGGLTYVHWPIPHAPVIFDRRTGRLTADGPQGYADNVALVDRTLGEARRAMEAAGVWDDATVLVSTDHWWRIPKPEDRRVPFLLKLSRQQAGIQYQRPFSTVLTRWILFEALIGNLSRPDEVVRWLDDHADPRTP